MKTYTYVGPKYSQPYTNCLGVTSGWTSLESSYTRTVYDDESVKRPYPADPLFDMTGYSNSMFDVSNGFMYRRVSCTTAKRFHLQPTTVKDHHGLAAPNFTLTYRTATTNRLLAKIKSQRVNLAMALATYGQTARLFHEAVEMLWDAYRCAKSPKKCLGKLRKKKKSIFGVSKPFITKNTRLKKGSGKYLAYTYGVTPLVNDIQGSIAELEEALDRGIIWRVRVRDIQKSRREATYGSNVSTILSREILEERSDIAIAYVEFDRPFLATMSSLGLTNPAFVLWDAIPFSFVVDWFLDVGTYLNNLDALSGVKRYSAFYTTKHRAVETRVSKHGGVGVGRRRLTSRSLLTLTPKVNAGSGLSLLRSLNALALLRQRI